ncbi:hypothetical protein CMEL01_07509 [Colletotrichum melonis]|uniref:Uncharacterized protein n=1 Tax=Colletotrichum melonis TaxID=1209925 RepID=A0AAI9U4D7_9PEZI|nr:hypothetical protein CMEL01_07509 [Colletotrichum melonis]
MLQVGKLQVAVSRKKHRHFRPTQFAARNSNPGCLLCPSRGRDPLCVGAFFGFYCYILQLHITARCLDTCRNTMALSRCCCYVAPLAMGSVKLLPIY